MLHSKHYYDKELELIILWHALELEGRIFNFAETLPKRDRTVRSTKNTYFLFGTLWASRIRTLWTRVLSLLIYSLL
jgi:hypothetical protein